MSKIKFRGKVIWTGEIVFGDLIHDDNGAPLIRRNAEKHFVHVEPESVKQFCGYDANDEEVYEGDTLIDENGHEWVAALDSTAFWKEYFKKSDEPKTYEDMILKKRH